MNSDYHYFEERTRINKTNAEFGPYFLRPIYNGLSTERSKSSYFCNNAGAIKTVTTPRERERERESMLVSKTFNFRITFLDLPFRQQRLKRDKEDGGT